MKWRLWKKKERKEQKFLINEIEDFLEYIGRDSLDKNHRKEGELKKRFGEKNLKDFLNLCFEGTGYIECELLSDKKDRERIFRLTAKGLKFLEEQRRQKIQLKQIDAQNFLTLGILSFAIFSGIITLIYYYFELKYSVGNGSNPIIFAGVAILLIIIIGIWKFLPKK